MQFKITKNIENLEIEEIKDNLLHYSYDSKTLKALVKNNISNDNKPSNNVKETDNTTNKISNIINPHTGDYIIAVIIVLIIAISINVIIISKRRKGGNK